MHTIEKFTPFLLNMRERSREAAATAAGDLGKFHYLRQNIKRQDAKVRRGHVSECFWQPPSPLESLRSRGHSRPFRLNVRCKCKLLTMLFAQ